jgi:superfamily II DNA or RNA helicase
MVTRLRAVLGERPGLTATELEAAVGADSVGRYLHAYREFFVCHGDDPVRWFAIAPGTVAPSPVNGMPTPLLWQSQALAAWANAGRRGVIEAVTGTGKTIVGALAVEGELAAGGKALVLVPSVALQTQWSGVLSRCVPSARLGLRGDGEKGTLAEFDVIVSTVHSAVRGQAGLPTRGGLLIADECHRYGAGTFAMALHDRFDRRLGLTATFERSDDGLIEYLLPYFGRVCFSLGYEQALRDNITTDWKVATVGVSFGPSERLLHDVADKDAREARRFLVERCHVRAAPFGEFMHEVAELAARGFSDPCGSNARKFLAAFSKRRELLATARAKFDALASLGEAIAEANGSLVFCERVDAAAEAVSVLNDVGIRAGAMSSELTTDQRDAVLRDLRDARLQVLAAPRVLDEGIDVPEADLGVILASSSQKRQMIQRMGRVIRRKRDGRSARFVILYVIGTSEDPARGAHEDFLDVMLPHALEIRDFRVPHLEGLDEFLRPAAVKGRPPPTLDAIFAAPSRKEHGRRSNGARTYANGNAFPAVAEPSVSRVVRARRVERSRRPSAEELADAFSINTWHSAPKIRAALGITNIAAFETELARIAKAMRTGGSSAHHGDLTIVHGSEVEALRRWADRY